MTKNMRVADPRVIVVGVKGSIGKLLAGKLASEAFEVIGIDIVDSGADVGSSKIALRTDDIIRPNAMTRAELATARIVVLAVCQKVIAEALPNILPYLSLDCLIVETLSTKSAFPGLLERHNVVQSVLGINPMFSGDLDPKGRPVATVVYRNGSLVSEFMALLEKWQLKIVPMDPAEHDRTMAVLQSLGHALVLSFGKTLSMSHLSASTIAMLAPPPFRVLLSLLARMTKNHPDVYWEIQADNPHAREVRENLQTAMNELDGAITSGARAEFHSDLGQMKSTLIDPNPSFLETSRQIFEFINVLHERKQFQSSENREMKLTDFRTQIDSIDDDIVDLLGRRLDIIRQVAQAKKTSDIPVMQPDRVNEVKRRCKERGQRNNVRGEFVETLYQLIIDEACHIEDDFVGNDREAFLQNSPLPLNATGVVSK